MRIHNAFYKLLSTDGRIKLDNNSVMYQFWQSRRHERNGQGPTPTAIAAACGTTIYAAKKAVTRYRQGRAAVAQPKGLDTKSIRNIHNMVSQAWVDAIGLGYMEDNPTTFAKLPRAARRTAEAKKVPWTVEELGRWLVVALKDRFGAMWLLAATCGLRRSELAGVSRLLLDLDAGVLHLHDTRVVVNGRAQDSDGKSEAGWRTVSLDPYTVSELETYLTMLGEERKGFGLPYPTHGKLMVWENGKQLHPDTITRRFNRLVDEARRPADRVCYKFCYKRPPRVPSEGPFVLVAGTGFEPATSGL